jgi:GxxExxY protein
VEDQMTHLRHERLTYELRGLIFEVRKKLKAGWSEEIYHQALVQLLKDRDIPFRSKPRKTITHRGIEVQIFECDMIVRDLIVLELKVLPFATFAARHYAQLFHYLKCWNKDLGLLVNFGPTRAQIERFVWDEPELEIRENYDAIRPDMTDADRLCLRRVRQNILAIAQQYGLGYPETMYRRIVAIEMDHNDLSCHANVEIPARFDSKVLTQHPSDHLLVEGNYLLNIRSLLDHPPGYDFARTKTYLNSLGLKFGLVVNFGKKQPLNVRVLFCP